MYLALAAMSLIRTEFVFRNSTSHAMNDFFYTTFEPMPLDGVASRALPRKRVPEQDVNEARTPSESFRKLERRD
jgi:hypothetical protein